VGGLYGDEDLIEKGGSIGGPYRVGLIKV